MRPSLRVPRRRAAVPTCEPLESRALLSASAVAHGSGVHAAQVGTIPLNPFVAGSVLSRLPAAATQSTSTIPGNGDVNPYGVAFVPAGFPRGGVLSPGDILVSNFNNADNQQGTGTTIVRVAPDGTRSLFFHGDRTPGLSTALGVLKRGFVIVGSTSSTNGQSNTAGPGGLLILDRNGNQVATITDPTLLNGVWDLTIHEKGDRAQVFISNVLSGAITRLDLQVPRTGSFFGIAGLTQIASGYTHRGDPNAFEIGPTGLAYDARRDVLYVASTGDNAIFAVPNAGRARRDRGPGRLVTQDPIHLHGPLGLLLTPDGHLIVANGDAVNPDPNQPNEIAEFTRNGRFVNQFSLDPTPGAAFGIALSESPRRLALAAVNDVGNTLDVFSTRR